MLHRGPHDGLEPGQGVGRGGALTSRDVPLTCSPLRPKLLLISLGKKVAGVILAVAAICAVTSRTVQWLHSEAA